MSPVQLEDILRAGEGRHTRLEIVHLLRRGGRLVVAAELGLRIVERAVQRGVVGVDRQSALGPHQGGGEVVLARLKCRLAGHCRVVVGAVDRQRSVERRGRLRVVRRVHSDLGLLHVVEAERCPGRVVIRPAAQRVLDSCDLPGELVATGRSRCTATRCADVRPARRVADGHGRHRRHANGQPDHKEHGSDPAPHPRAVSPARP